MKKTCNYCQKEFVGRSDKSYCSIGCKNEKNNALRKDTLDIAKEIDGYLHRNRMILSLLMGATKKEMFDKLVLTRAGFKFDFMTGIYLNKEGKMYRIVYDYAWMDFSDQKVLVVKKGK